MCVKVIGVPDERMGEELMAWIQPKDSVLLTEEEVRNFCKEKISHFKIPRYIRFVKEYPMTVTGKVKKFVLREQVIRELNLDKKSRSD